MIALLVAIFLFQLNHTHDCNHKEFDWQVGQKTGIQIPSFDEGNPNMERTVNSSWIMQIKIDTQNVSQTNLKVYQAITYVLSDLKNFLQNLLLISTSLGIPAFTNDFCNENLIINSSYGSGTQADLVIFAQTVTLSSNVLAQATYCAYDTTTYRPLIGIIQINLQGIDPNNIDFKQMKSIFLHETFHILAFSQNLFQNFQQNSPILITGTSMIDNTQISMLQSANIQTDIQSHFGCSSLNNIYLENDGGQGSSGSHFEKKLFGNEIMTAQITGETVLSIFTIRVINESGWYQASTSFAEKLYFGYQQGCNFISTSCSFPEFCVTPQNLSCDRSYQFKNYCVNTPFVTQCLVSEYYAELKCSSLTSAYMSYSVEQSGNSSRCFNTNIGLSNQSAACFQATCNSGGTQISFTVGGNNYVCNGTNVYVTYQSLLIYCPSSITSFCGIPDLQCTTNCSNKGSCNQTNGCNCDPFYSGANCSLRDTCLTTMNLICPAGFPTSYGNTNNTNNNNDTNSNTVSGLIYVKHYSFLILLGLLC